ncbi:MAG: ribbon-helix-helix protein, CopG family, partial [Gammaproteobacteria bacterium]|nr:ribbon-helix-helix protein, CopG family [Gammaproteobacteria bacterium]
MRTTIRLDEKLLKEAKRQAAESGMTLTAIIEESLRERLARTGSGRKMRQPVRLHVV